MELTGNYGAIIARSASLQEEEDDNDEEEEDRPQHQQQLPQQRQPRISDAGGAFNR
jgi:hypothetical protein